MDDIKESIAELKYYKDNIFKPQKSKRQLHVEQWNQLIANQNWRGIFRSKPNGLCKGLRSVHPLVFGFMALLLRGILKPSGCVSQLLHHIHIHSIGYYLGGIEKPFHAQVMNWSVKRPISLRSLFLTIQLFSQFVFGDVTHYSNYQVTNTGQI